MKTQVTQTDPTFKELVECVRAQAVLSEMLQEVGKRISNWMAEYTVENPDLLRELLLASGKKT